MTASPTSNIRAIPNLGAFKQELELAMPGIAKLLPSHVPVEKFKAVVQTAVTMNPDLLNVDRRSLFNACRSAAELGLSLNPALGEADILVTFDRRAGGKVARFSPRFGGLMKLGRQSGHLRTIYAHVVREKDTFDHELGTEKKLVHKPAHGERGDMTHVYCVWVLTDGTKDFEVMDKSQVHSIRSRTTAKNQQGQIVGPWVTDEEEMWRKTVVRRASKYWPRSAEINNLLRHTAGEEIDTFDADAAAVEADFGMAVDVTELDQPTPEAQPVEPEQRGAQQVNDLEKRLGAKPVPTPTPAAPEPQPAAAPKASRRARVLPVPQGGDGKPDWGSYATALQDILSSSEDMAKVLATNGVGLANLKASRPDLHDTLMQFVAVSGGDE